MDAVEQIELYGTLFYMFLGIAVLGLLLAVFFFFYFDIPSVRAMMTGKAKQATIRRMEEKNAQTGKLWFKYPGSTGDIHTGRTGSAGQTGAAQTVQPNPAPDESESETSILQSAAAETEVLDGAAAQRQQDGSVGQTARLNRRDSGFQFEITQSTVVIHTDEII